MAHHKVNPIETLSKNAESYNRWTVKFSVCNDSADFVEENGGIASGDSSQLTPIADYGQLAHVVRPRKRKRGSPFTPAEFWQYVAIAGPDECWLWQDTVLARNGYGAFWYPPTQQTMSAHRVAWLLTHGPIAAGLEVMHGCDTPRCCNVFGHLRLGTHQDNMADMHAKGRRASLKGRKRGPFSAAHRLALSMARKRWLAKKQTPTVTLSSSAARVDPARAGAAHSRAGDQSVPARLISVAQGGVRQS